MPMTSVASVDINNKTMYCAVAGDSIVKKKTNKKNKQFQLVSNFISLQFGAEPVAFV